VDYESIRFAVDGRIATITINRPEVRNALDLAANREMAHAFERFRDEDELWIAILTGAGDRAFCAGADLRGAAAGPRLSLDERPPFGGITRGFHTDKPIIAALNGLAVGGGLELALAADIVVASEDARLGLPEPRVGVLAGAGGIHRLARQIPLKVAMGLILTGELIGAREAHRLGLVNTVVPANAVMSEARRWAESILRCAPLSIRTAKARTMKGLGSHGEIDRLIREDDEALKHLRSTFDFQEGPKAFLEKREPVWQGR
jgi:crotonobetainyl-CoA hydratase